MAKKAFFIILILLFALNFSSVSAQTADGVQKIHVHALGWNGEKWLIGGRELPEGPSFLVAYNGKEFYEIAPGEIEETWIEEIHWNGSSWVVEGRVPGLKNVTSKEAGVYTIEDMSVILVEKHKKVSGNKVIKECNGSYCLLWNGTTGKLFRNDQGSYTDLTPKAGIQYPHEKVTIMVWNGEYWLIGYGGTGGGGLDSYNGESFSTVELPNSTTPSDVEWNGEYWLIGTLAGPRDSGSLVMYDGEKTVDMTPELLQAIGRDKTRGDRMAGEGKNTYSGCPMYQHDPANTGATEEKVKLPLKLKWKYSTQHPGPIRSSPAVSNGTVYMAWKGAMGAIDASTGKLLWNHRIEKDGPVRTSSSPAVAKGLVYAGVVEKAGSFKSDNYYLYALNASTGKVVWESKTMNGSYFSHHPSPTAVDGEVFVGADSGYLYCMDSRDGEILWRYEANGSISSTPAVENEKVYIGSRGGYVYALDKDTGDLIWKYTTGREMTSSPTVSRDRVYIASLNGDIYSLNASSGEFLWERRIGEKILYSGAVSRGRLFVGSTKGIYALDAKTGELIWENRDINPGAAPSIAKDSVFLGSHRGIFYALDHSTGEVKWSYNTTRDTTLSTNLEAPDKSLSSASIAGGNVYVGGYNGRIYAFEGEEKPLCGPTAILLVTILVAVFVHHKRTL